MAGVIGLRGPDIMKRDALRGYKVVFEDADRPLIRPHTGSPVLFLDEEGEPRVERHVFGFSKRFSSFNARADRLREGKLWKGLFGKPDHHGVAPVSYILEWADLGDGRGKLPYRIERADGAAMAVPALVGDYWEKKGTRAFALVTVEPNEFVRTFHDRMIGQLADAAIDRWLRPDPKDTDALVELLRAPPNDELVAVPIHAEAGKARFDDPDALRAVGAPVAWKDVRAARTGAASAGSAGKAKRPAKRAPRTAGAKGTRQRTLSD